MIRSWERFAMGALISVLNKGAVGTCLHDGEPILSVLLESDSNKLAPGLHARFFKQSSDYIFHGTLGDLQLDGDLVVR
jgi:hypothetical protein